MYTSLGSSQEKQEANTGNKTVAGNCVRVFNSLSWEREEWFSYNNTWVKAKVPAMGYRVLSIEEQNDDTLADIAARESLAVGTPASLPTNENTLNKAEVSETQNTLENESYTVVFSPEGFIESIYDKEEKREVIPTGETANKLVMYEDQGDAWDFPIYYDEIPGEALILTESKVYREGPKLIRLNRFRTAAGESQLEQKVILTSGSRRIDFVTQADWKESAKMLRTSFPVKVRAQEATCEIQFGNIKRPTHRNTSWDMAKYEVSTHKWVDISQGDYGVALLNDCKYGHKLIDNIIDLNLLRSTAYPDTAADKGRHEFTYSLYPHKGDYIEGRVVRAGYELNVPLQVLPADASYMTEESESLVSVEAENVIIESVKKCEESGDLILRLYECHGRGVRAKINLAFKPEDIQLVDLMEKETSQAGLEKDMERGNSCTLEFKPFEINTLKMSLRSKA
ncbi:MAG: alpha-mannosidase [Anaerocolumna sp.]|nr:alpha-mannosidase [Anaerocolumna sp.]